MNFKMNDKVIVFSDLDGTALNNDHKFSQETIDIVEKIYKNGDYFFPITARSTSDTIRQAKLLKIDKLGGIVAGNNGSQIYDFKKEKWIFNYHINDDIVHKIFDKTYGKQGQYKVNYFGDDTTYVYGPAEQSQLWSDIMQLDYKVVKVFDEIKKPITHLTIILNKDVTDEEIKEFYDDFSTLNNELDIIQYTKRVYEMCGKGIHKGFAVKKIYEYLGLNNKNATSFAFGDGHNDIELFKSVDYDVAMANGLMELIESSKATTSKTNDQNGVAIFIEENILNRRK